MAVRINLPNRITLARTLLSVVFFVLLAFIDVSDVGTDGPPTGTLVLIWAAFVVFVVSILGDFWDGYLARRYGQTTVFGRVVDPFADKLIVLGGFLFLLGENMHDPFVDANAAGLSAWMVAVILGRELLITSLRSVAEKEGVAFGASWIGKAKTWIQSFALGGCILRLLWAGQPAFAGSFFDWLTWLLVYFAVLFTLWSMIDYLWRGREFMRMHHEDEPAPASALAEPEIVGEPKESPQREVV